MRMARNVGQTGIKLNGIKLLTTLVFSRVALGSSLQ